MARFGIHSFVLAGILISALPGLAADDLVVADFEGANWGEWKAKGEAFGLRPAPGTLPGQMPVEGFQGTGLVNSFYGGDATIGTLTSPPFTIARRFIRFLIGGGKDAQKTCMQLLVDGRVVRAATGPNDKPGGSEVLAPEAWDVTELTGQTAVIQIIDQATGGWGHINVDHIVQSDQRPPALALNPSRTLRIENRYLNFPIKHGAPKRKVTISVAGHVQVVNDMELADAAPDWWAFMDVGAWLGKKVTITVDTLREDSKALTSIEVSQDLRGAESLYREPSRGQFHFSSRRGWNNDPNGLVYFQGKYHLFYQHNPYGWDWGNMHWGHAVSRDLVHWEELGDALAPDDFGPMFSGSAVVDWNNTSDLGTKQRPPLMLIYTAAGDPTVQCIASSTDGKKFTKFDGNPVLKQITGGNRDPKVFWHEPTQKWVMVLYVEVNKVHTIQFFSSINLKDWTYLSRTDGLFECPDFFPLPIDGEPSKRKWVLAAASSEYLVGTFDGVTFTPETPKLPGHRGRGFYAAQTFSDIPIKDGRRIEMGWFQTPTPGMSFNQSMTIPQELKLVTTADGPRLTRTPVKELQVLRADTRAFPTMTLTPGSTNLLSDMKSELVELCTEFTPDSTSELILTIRGATIVYEGGKQELTVNGHRAPAPLQGGKQRLTIFCDRNGLEVFASDGLTYVPMPFLPQPENQALAIRTAGGNAKIASLEVHRLKSAWRRNSR